MMPIEVLRELTKRVDTGGATETPVQWDQYPQAWGAEILDNGGLELQGPGQVIAGYPPNRWLLWREYADAEDDGKSA